VLILQSALSKPSYSPIYHFSNRLITLTWTGALLATVLTFKSYY
jgi:hypothetical protein